MKNRIMSRLVHGHLHHIKLVKAILLVLVHVMNRSDKDLDPACISLFITQDLRGSSYTWSANEIMYHLTDHYG